MSFIELLNNKQSIDILFNQLHCPLLYVSFDGIIKDANIMSINMLSLNKKNYIGSDLLKHCQKNNLKLARLLINYESVEGASLIETYYNKKKHFTILWEKIFFPTTKNFLLIGNDITKENNLINELNDSRFFYENILSKLPTNVYWKDRNSVYVGCNDRLAKSLGLASPKDIVGLTDFDFGWDKETAESFISFDQKIMNTGKPATTEDVFAEHSGKVVTVLTNKTPLKDIKGNIIGVLAISVDITELKKTQEDLRISKEKAEASSLAKSAFISNMGHDLISPFIGIESYADILSDHYSEKDPTIKEFWDFMLAGIIEAKNVISEIIEATAAENPSVKLESFSINQTLDEVKTLLLCNTQSKKLDIIINKLDPNESDIIETDKLRFKLILNNLASNAIKFTDEGSITFSVLRKDDYFHIKVSDTGIGIPKDQLNHIFELFTKLSPSNIHNTFQGTGSGLTSAKTKAEELGAIIEVESEPGKGSTFTLIIPVRPK